MSKSFAEIARHPVRAAVILALALAALVVGIMSVSAANVAGFEIEGDLFSNNDSPAGRDWATGAAGASVCGVLIPDATAPNGGTDGKSAPVDNPACPSTGTSVRDLVSAEPGGDDDVFTLGSKETDFTDANNDKTVDNFALDVPDWTIEPGNVPPNKDDFSFIYGYSNIAATDIVDIGFERLNFQGDSHLSFEFDPAGTQVCASDSDSVCPKRTPVGSAAGPSVLVSFDLQNGGRIVITRVFHWDPAFGPGDPVFDAQSQDKKKEYPWKEVPAASAGVLATALNQGGSIPTGPWGSVDNSGDLRTSIGIRGFFEMAADLSDIGISPGCPGITNIWVKSRASAEISAALKDVELLPFDLTNCGSKAGTKYEDVDGDGDLSDTVNALPDWTINLYRDDGTTPGALDASDTGLGDDVTDVNGAYKFADLPPDDYIVEEECLTGWAQTYPTPDSATEADCGTGVHAFTIDPFEDETGNDFGNFETVDVETCKYEDLDGDGDADAPIEGWTVKLTKNGEVQDTQTTGANGCYKWENLGPVPGGYYDVTETVPAGWTATSATSHNFELPPQSGASYTFTFTNFENVDVEACKVHDRDGDLATTGDQTPIEGWTVKLTKNGEVQDTQTTGANGCYKWENLGPVPGGYYDVSEVVPAGWIPLTPTSHDFESPPQSGASYSFTFKNTQLYRLIIVTCNEADDTLVVSSVDLDGDVKQTISTPPAGLTHAELCNLGGAQYNTLPANTYTPDVELPDLP